MHLPKFTKKLITVNSVAILLSAGVIPIVQPPYQTVHATSTDDSGVSTWNNWGTVKWGIDGNGTLWIKPQSGSTGTLGSLNGWQGCAPWSGSQDSFKIKSVKLEGTIVAASECRGLFLSLINCTDMDLTNLDTSKVTDMSDMFYGCSSLTNLNVSNWDTSNVTNMKEMFRQCYKLTNLDVSNWDTSKVTDMSDMFYGCSSLTNLNVSNWNTSNVTNMKEMFDRCSNLTNLNVSKWNTSNVTDMSDMFYDCSNLTYLDVSNWNTSQVTNMDSMFYDCSSLTNLNVSKWDTSQVTDMNFMFGGCSNLTYLDVSKWDTSKVTDMIGMFYDCSSLTNLNVSNWDTSQVTDMRQTFYNCSSLTNLNVSNWNTSQVTNMSEMFAVCSSLTNLDVSKWDTSKVTDMIGMFYDCPSLTNLDVSNWNTSKAIMDFMFDGCSKLSELKLGEGFKVPSEQDTQLPDPAKTGEYTGRWSKADGSNGMSASEMMNLTGQEHDASGKSLNKTLTQEDRAGTWVWERGYTVTLDPNGGNGSPKTFTAVLSQDQVFGKDSANVYITDPGYTKSPATLIGASEQKDGSGTRYQYPFTYEINGNKTLYAQWQEPTYTIKFDANNGSGSMDSEEMTLGSSKALSKNTFTRKMYDFAGWNTEKDGTGKSYTNQQSVSDIADAGKTITLYAQWKKASWYDSGMSKTDTSDNNKHDPNTYIVTIPTQITKTGRSVGNINESVTYSVNVTGNIPDGNYVHISASTNNKLTGKNGNLDLSVKQGKTLWSEAEAYGTINQDGSLSGTTASDTVTISGTAKSVDQYTGLITYSAYLSTSEK